MNAARRKLVLAVAVLKLVALALVCAILAPIAYEVWHQRPAFESDVRRVSALIGRTEQTMDNFKEATDTWKESAREQASKTTEAMSNVSAAAKQFSISIAETQSSVSGLLLTSQEAIKQENVSLLETQMGFRQSLISSQKVTDEAQKVLVDLDRQVSDPNVKQSIDNFAVATKNASDATAQLALATKESAATIKDVHGAVDYEIKQLEAPVKKIRVVFNVALDVIRRLYF